MFMPPVFPAHWHVSQPVLIADTFSSLVWKVSLPDGTPAIVKGLKPIEDIADELRGADYLVWRNGRGAVRLLGRENNLMLLEYAGERMLSHIVAEHGDYQATEIAAELMAKLYAASEEPLPSALLPIRDRFAALFQRARDDQNAGCQTDYVHAAIIADQMMSNASELRGLHGDLQRIGISNGLWPASGLWKARLMHGWPADTGLDGLELTAATSSCRDSAWPLTDRSGLAGPWYQG